MRGARQRRHGRPGPGGGRRDRGHHRRDDPRRGAAVTGQPPAPVASVVGPAGVRRGRLIVSGLAILILVAAGLFVRARIAWLEAPPPDTTTLGSAEQKEYRALRQRAESLEQEIAALRPRGTYIVIDAGRNLLT